MVRSVEQNNTKADTKGDHANEVIKILKKNKWEREKGRWPEHGAVRGHGDKLLFFFTCVALLKTMLQDYQILKKKKKNLKKVNDRYDFWEQLNQSNHTSGWVWCQQRKQKWLKDREVKQRWRKEKDH